MTRLSTISWDDSQLLLRVIEERFQHSFEQYSPDEVWSHFFVSQVEGVPVKQYLIENSLPRPRDMIYLVRTAIAFAVNRGHSRVDADDLLAAEERLFAVRS